MAASTGIATPIYPIKVLIGGTAQAVVRRLYEKAAQTFNIGTPVQVDAATGFLFAAPAIVSAATALIAGFSQEPGNNLTTSGVAKTLTYGSVQNQSAAVLIPVGAPPNDGTMGFTEAVDSTIFVGTLGNSATASLATTAQTNLGAIYGLTKDAGNGYWYIDNNITTTAGGACVEITDLLAQFAPLPINTTGVGILNGLLGFKVLHAAQQLSGS
jgi:hypothetical protein